MQASLFSFCLFFHQLPLNHHHLLSWIQQALSKPVPCHSLWLPFLLLPTLQPQSSFQKAKPSRPHTDPSTLPTLSRPLRWLLMAQKTLTALSARPSRPAWEPSDLPRSSPTTCTPALRDSLHLQEFPALTPSVLHMSVHSWACWSATCAPSLPAPSSHKLSITWERPPWPRQGWAPSPPPSRHFTQVHNCLWLFD